MTLLSQTADDGLDPEDYHHEILARLVARVDTDLPSPTDLAQFDVALSAGILQYHPAPATWGAATAALRSFADGTSATI